MNFTELELEPGAIGAIAFVAVAVWLLIYRFRHNAKRRETLATMMPTLGFNVVDQPSPQTLVPDLLFYPNGLSPPGEPPGKGGYIDLMPRVPSAWKARLASRDVIVMDVEVDRSRVSSVDSSSSNRLSGQGAWTVLRWDPGAALRPPDLLIADRFRLSKKPPRGARTINGRTRIGKHYFIFSSAPDAALEPWITQGLCEQLAKHRLWKIAAHNGVFYLTMASSTFIQPRYMRQFVREGEALLSGLVAAQRS